jgi:glycopeptide antibiotics resistance protein
VKELQRKIIWCIFESITPFIVNKEQQIRRSLNILVFILYTVVLINLVLIKGPLFYQFVSPYGHHLSHHVNPTHKAYNLVPFHTIKIYVSNDTWNSIYDKCANLSGNIAVFSPFGFLLPLVFRRFAKFRYTFLATVLLSSSFEFLQFFSHTGFCDVDDVILNSLGGVIGFSFFLIIYR